MRAGFGVLVASAWLGAGLTAAWAQAPEQSGGVILDGCGATCRFLHSLTAPTPAPEPHAETPAAEPEAERPRRSRRSSAPRRAPAAPATEQAAAPVEPVQERRPRAKPADTAVAKAPAPAPRAPARDVEQTAAIPQGPAEVRFVARPDDSHAALAADLAAALAPEFALRPVAGTGAPLADLASPPGADLTLASSLALARGDATDKVVYVAKVFTEELHALAAPGIGRVEDLQGKPVYLGAPDSDGHLAATTFLDARGVDVAPVSGSLAQALDALRQGRIAAAFVLAPKPFALVAEMRGGNLTFLPLAYRSSDVDFHPAALTAADYPGLIGEGRRVETVALDTVLVAPRWRDTAPRQRVLVAAATRLFERFGAAAAGRHPKWAETNLAATVDGLQRLKPAQQWVAARLKGRDAPAGAAVREASVPGAAR